MDSIALDARDVNWRWLLKIGGISSLLSVVVLRLQTILYISSPSPHSFISLSESLHIHMILSLLFMDLLFVLDGLVHLPLFISLFILLRRTDSHYALIALQTVLVASIVHFASNTALHLLTLNGYFFAAANEWEQAATLSYAATLMNIDGNAPSYISHLLASLAGVIFAVVMLRSHLFGNIMAWFGIIGNLLACGIFIPVIGIYFSALVATFVGIWYLIIAWKLLWLASNPYLDYGPPRYRLFVQ